MSDTRDTPSPAVPIARPPWARMVRALGHRNFRLFFGGQGVSLIGTWMQTVALSWLVYRLTDSPRLLGLVGFSGQIPVLLLAPLAGVLADRWRRRSLLVGTQSAALVQASILAALTLSRTISVGSVLLLSLMLGTINAFDMPTRQAFVPEMVERPEDLPNAIALNSMLVNGARLVGPALAGVLIGAIGEGACFLLNAISYVAVIIALLAMRIRPRVVPPAAPVWRNLREGFAYAFGFPPIRDLLLLLALLSLMGMSYGTLLPVFARDILGGGPHTLGFLFGATGVGAVAGVIFLAGRPSVRGLGRIIAAGSAIAGVGLVSMAFSRTLWLSLLLMMVAGCGMMLQIVSTNTMLQTLVDDDKRGRVMSLYSWAFLGINPLGALLAGELASRLGAPAAVCIGGTCCVLGGIAFALRLPSLRPLVRPILVRKGAIPAETAVATAAGVRQQE